MRTHLLVALTSSAFLSCSLFALPKDAHCPSGEAHLHLVTPEKLHITTSDKAIINWKEFSIGLKESVHFMQPSASSLVLNRVKGSQASHILGQLTANGKVYLINRNGIIFGKDSIIQTADFLASTHDILDENFLMDHELLFQGDSLETIINYGTIEARDGNIVLLGRLLDNQGTLLAPQGQVALAAGQEILLKPESTPILSIRPHLQEASVTHAGTIQALIVSLQAEGQPHTYGINLNGSVLALNPVAQDGKIYLRSDSICIAASATLEAQSAIAIDTTGGALYNEGHLQVADGSIHIHATENSAPFYNIGSLDAGSGDIQIHVSKMVNTGKLLAEGKETGGTISIHTAGPYIETASSTVSVNAEKMGGTIDVVSDTTLFSSGTHVSQAERGGALHFFAPEVTLVGATLDASGSAQGGDILIDQAEITHIIGNTSLLTNAITSGDGGKIIVSSNQRTVCYGSMQAKGGVQAGDGGVIEISSKNDLYCNAALSATAPQGKTGYALLDPKNIIIDATTGVFPQYEYIDPNSGGGTGFGSSTVALSTGNIVITKPSDNFAASAAGAAYLYNQVTAALISTLTGSQANDQVGSSSVTALTNGNYVIRSPNWDNGATANAGAATWGSGTTGIAGVVSAANSLVGSTASDQVGSVGVIALTNGNYVVGSSNWDNGATANVGAATWGSGTTGIAGVVSAANSLVGSTVTDQVSSGSITALTNGNYVVRSPNWDNGATANVGAATWGNGTTGITGAVSAANSLVGSTVTDQVSSGGVTALTNGNYVVRSFNWANGAATVAGAVTWGNGTTGVTGAVSVANSLVGSTTNDQISSGVVVVLTNGNYVVGSPNWDNGAATNAGAVTWGNGTTGVTGAVSVANSLVGSTTNDQVGTGVIALANDNYVVRSPNWDNGATTDVGAATWGNGTTGIVGAVSVANSLVGSTTGDQIGGGVTALTNGNYVVRSSFWDNGATANVGAVTWGNGTTGITGAVSTANSLVGTTAGDSISSNGTAALTNGNYVILSTSWNNGAATVAGAVTWGNGTTGTTGVVSIANSLVGSTTNDAVGTGVIALANGNYVVRSPNWDNGATTDVGAATWGNGTTGTAGAVSITNSLVGTTTGDQVSSGATATVFTNGNYVVTSPNWDNGALVNAGAATWGNGSTGTVGPVTTANSIVGATANAGLMNVVQDSTTGLFFARFFTEGSGKVRVGYADPSQISFLSAEAQTMRIAPSFITSTLDAGTDVVLQANNDITISSALASTLGAGDLTLRAGRSIALQANIATGNGSLTVIANDLLADGVVDAYRDAGDATLTIGNNVTIDTGTGNLTLSILNGAGKTYTGSGDLIIADNATLQASGSGIINITAQEQSITLGNNTLVQTVNGNLTLSAGKNIIDNDLTTIRTLGAGQLTLVVDSLFPTAPLFGLGHVTLPFASLSTGGGKLLIYTAERSFNTLPETINGVAYVPGPLTINSTTEQWGVYYPHSSGIPFTIFYKIPSATQGNILTAVAEPFIRWRNPWYDDDYLSTDPYPPYLTPKGLRLVLPSLVHTPKQPE